MVFLMNMLFLIYISENDQNDVTISAIKLATLSLYRRELDTE